MERPLRLHTQMQVVTPTLQAASLGSICFYQPVVSIAKGAMVQTPSILLFNSLYNKKTLYGPPFKEFSLWLKWGRAYHGAPSGMCS